MTDVDTSFIKVLDLCIGTGSQFSSSRGLNDTPPKFNSEFTPEKLMVGKTSFLSFWGPADFQGQAVKLPGSVMISITVDLHGFFSKWNTAWPARRNSSRIPIFLSSDQSGRLHFEAGDTFSKASFWVSMLNFHGVPDYILLCSGYTIQWHEIISLPLFASPIQEVFFSKIQK